MKQKTQFDAFDTTPIRVPQQYVFDDNDVVEKSYKQQMEEACEEIVIRNNFNLFVTLPFNIKQQNRKHISDEKKLKALSKFFNNLDTLAFGKAKRLKGIRLPRLVGIHYGTSKENLHAHAYFVEQEIHTKDGSKKLSDVIRQLWDETEGFTHLAHVRKFHTHKHANKLIEELQQQPIPRVFKIAKKCFIQAQQHRSSYLVHEVIGKDTDWLSSKFTTVM
jgi:hypothetical protein